MFKKIKFFLFQSFHRPSAKVLHFYVLIKKIFYNKKTNLFSEKTLLMKSPPASTIYYNLFGRMLFIVLNFFSILLFNKFAEAGLYLETKEKLKNQNVNLLNTTGDDFSPWPRQAMHHFEKNNEKINEGFFKKMEEDYHKSIELIKKDNLFKESTWWLRCREEFKKIFLETDGKLNLTSLNNFRNNVNTRAEILIDQNYISSSNSNLHNKLKSLGLVNLYHKLSNYVDLDVLRMCSESRAGNNLCVIYREQRISHRILRYAYYVSQIQKNTNLKFKSNNIIMDLGGAYGGLSRFLKNIYTDSTFVIIELPEMCALAAFFLKKCFPNKKIGSLSDFEKLEKIDKNEIVKFDFIILPQPIMEKFEDEMFDLCINTTSLGEMTEEMQQYYIDHIERLSKEYFYSVNRPKKSKKYNTKGFYDFKFKKRWKSIIYNFNHVYHIEFLGKKINE